MSTPGSINALKRSMGRLVELYINKAGKVDYNQAKMAYDSLKSGGVVAIPTDTIYGLAVNANDSSALEKVYQIKGRDFAKPLAVCIPSHESISDIADISDVDEKILKALLPGPVTILLRRSRQLNECLNPGTHLVGVRMPDHDFVSVLCNMVGPLALTSANKSGGMNPIHVADFRDLWPEIDIIFDQGPVCHRRPIDDDFNRNKLGSTVVDLSKKGFYQVIREGCALNRTQNVLEMLRLRPIKCPESKLG